MKRQIAYAALAIAAFGFVAPASPASASTDEDIAALKARLQQLEAQVARQRSSGGAAYNPRGTGQGLIGTGTSGSNSGEVGDARGAAHSAEHHSRSPGLQRLLYTGTSTSSRPEPAAAGTTGRYEGGSAPDPSASLQHWYDRISIRGYTQMRYTNILSAGPFYEGMAFWADNSARPRSNFLIRRMRLIISGDVSDHLYIYIQPDFASTPPGGFSNSATYFAATNSSSVSGVGPGGSSGIAPGYYGVYQGPYQPVNSYYQTQIGSYNNATGHFTQLRDAYADIYFDHDKEFRIRAGQSKVPYGFTNMQSSQNRLTLDRPDALNTAVRDERDLGLFFYYTPKEMRHLFRDLVKNNLKGSGDYGMLGFGVYNGQGANRVELNKDLHVVARATYPYVFENGQVIEASIQGYTGRVQPYTSAIRPSLGMATNWAGFIPNGTPFQPGSASYLPVVVAPGYNVPGNYNLGYWPRSTGWAATCANGCQGIKDSRVALTGVIYPQPFGVQAEWNWGVTPGLNATQTAITAQKLNGGYVLVNYKYEDKEFGLGTFFPFVQYQYFNGFSKYEVNAPQNRVNEWDIGVEYQPLPEVEISAVYNKADRTNITAAPYRQFQADTIRWQLQWNY
jgi:hypothetical protein